MPSLAAHLEVEEVGAAETSGLAAGARAATPALPEPRRCGQGKGVGQRHPAAAAPAPPARAGRAETEPLS